MGPPQLKSSLPQNIEDGGVSRGHYSRKPSSTWQKRGSSIGYTPQIVVVPDDKNKKNSCCADPELLLTTPEIAHVPENAVRE